jgi:hypothetical protein
MPTAPNRPETSASLRRETVALQLDDVNVFAEALAAAFNEDDDQRIEGIRASLDRYVLALGWNAGAVVPAVVAYAAERRDDDEDLFAPAYVLSAIAPGREEAKAVRARLSPDAEALLSRLLSG